MEDLTYVEQFIEDNTWKNSNIRTCEDECPYCEHFDAHPITEGSTAWDRYSYSTCTKCFKKW